MKIEEEIMQPSFQNEFEKADINILFTSNWMNATIHQVLKPNDVSIQQFNILRILRGQKGKPAPLKLITERMLDKMSNTSRLVDKMMAKKFLERKICSDNRRQVEIAITKHGLKVCDKISIEIEANRK